MTKAQWPLDTRSQMGTWRLCAGREALVTGGVEGAPAQPGEGEEGQSSELLGQTRQDVGTQFARGRRRDAHC